MSNGVPFLARTKSFTRRSRDLSAPLERGLAKYRETHLVEVPRDVGMTTVDPSFRLDTAAVFGRNAPLVIEIGSGRGEQIIHAAQQNPGTDFLAFEVWVPGIARLVSAAGDLNLENVRVIEADAQLALETMLPECSVSEVWTFFPDPWRKSRHHKRRLVSSGFANTVAGLLVDRGRWRLATDWEDYANQMLTVVNGCAELSNPFALGPETQDSLEGESVPRPGTGGFAPRFEERVRTHFEERGAKAGREVWDLTAVRIPRSPESPAELEE